MSSNPLPISVSSPIPIHIESSSTDWFSSISSVVLTLATVVLVIVNIWLIKQSKKDNKDTIDAMKLTNKETIETMKSVNEETLRNMNEVNRDNQKISLLTMKHDSNLDIYAVILAGMLGTIDLTEWLIDSSKVISQQVGMGENGVPRYAIYLDIPPFDKYPEAESLSALLVKFRSMETKARIDLLGNEELGMQVVQWIARYDLAMKNWSEQVEGLLRVIEGGSTDFNHIQSSLLSLQTTTTHETNALKELAMSIKSQMQSKLDGDSITFIRSTSGARHTGN